MDTDLPTSRRVLTFDVIALGCGFPETGEKIVKKRPFKGNEPAGALENLLATLTDSTKYTMYMFESSIDESVELVGLGKNSSLHQALLAHSSTLFRTCLTLRSIRLKYNVT
jgi:hypothetical protein